MKYSSDSSGSTAVTFTVPKAGAWEVRATAQDGSGFASVFFGEGALHAAPDIPRANLYRMEHLLQAAMNEMDTVEHPPGALDSAPHPGPERAPARAGEAQAPSQAAEPAHSKQSPEERPLPPYSLLRSTFKTAFFPDTPRRSVELHLTGDMQRYVWSFDGKTIDETSTIPVRKGEVLRLVLINDTMMHHPIHLHGHFFRLLNGQGDFAPLKHTVDVPPMGRKTLEFEANEQGDWMFHCHILYHMMEGMARVLQYAPAPTTPPKRGPFEHQAARHPPGDLNPAQPHLGEHSMPMVYAFTDFNILSHASEGSARLLSGKNELKADWEAGWRKARTSLEYEVDILYERSAGAHLGLLAGARLSKDQPGGDRPVAGLWTRFPYLITSTVTLDGKGAARLALAKQFQITSRFALETKGHYDTRTRWEEVLTASYVLSKKTTISASYHSEFGIGAGLGFHF